MSSAFGWVDFGEEHRRRTLDLVSLFNERDTRDELGLGVVRDGIADTLFPGTSTIQTRARYFLFIPWIYGRHERRGTERSEIGKLVRRDEDRLTESLAKSEDTNGVIGLEARETLLRPASNVYWAGLQIWRIRRFPGSQDQYQRRFEQFHRDDRRSSELPEGEGAVRDAAWDPRLPEAPDDFLEKDSLALRPVEARYLSEKIGTLHVHAVAPAARQPSTLSVLVGRRDEDLRQELESAAAVWALPLHRFSTAQREHIHHAKCFAAVMHGAALLYNLLLAEKAANRADFIEEYRQRLAEWEAERGSDPDMLRWDRQAFWAFVESTGAQVGPGTTRFINRWCEIAFDKSSVIDRSDARELIRDREWHLKKARARLHNEAALARWGGSSGAERLNYRWGRVSAIARDILAGLEGGTDART